MSASPLVRATPSTTSHCMLLSSFLARRPWDKMNLSQVVENVRELVNLQSFFIVNLRKAEGFTFEQIKAKSLGYRRTKAELNQGKARLAELIPQIERFIHDRVDPNFGATGEVTLINANRIVEAAGWGLRKEAHAGNRYAIQAFTENGLMVDLRNSQGQTALMSVAAIGAAGDESAVATLLGAGANPHLRDNDGQTALMKVAKTGSFDCNMIAERLLDRGGVDANLQDKEGRTALMWAARSDKNMIVESIGRHGANLDLQDKFGRTAFMYAAKLGQIKAMRSLLLIYKNQRSVFEAVHGFQGGPNLDLRDNEGRTALMYAERNQQEPCARLLIEAGAKREQQPIRFSPRTIL